MKWYNSSSVSLKEAYKHSLISPRLSTSTFNRSLEIINLSFSNQLLSLDIPENQIYLQYIVIHQKKRFVYKYPTTMEKIQGEGNK